MQMKRDFLIFILILGNAFGMQAQLKPSKRLIDNETYKTWETLGQYDISSDGRYGWYQYGTESGPRSLVLCTTDGKYKREFSGAHTPVFTTDSRRLIFDSAKGLAIIEMDKDSVQYLQANRYSVPKDGTGQWLSYYPKKGGIILKDLVSGQEKKYPEAKASWFNEQGTIWIVQTSTCILQVSLPSGDEKTILHGAFTNNIAFDAAGTKIAFIASGPHGNALRYYQSDMDTAGVHVTDNSPEIQKGFIISDEVPQFSQDGHNIFFKLVTDKTSLAIQRDSTVITDKVEVWHYKDKYLLSHQLAEVLPELVYRTYIAISNVNTKKVTQLESADIKLNWQMSGKLSSRSVLVSNIINDTESYWNKDHIAKYQLLSLQNGDHKEIFSELHAIQYCQLSPDERFVTCYDRERKNYFSYEVATGITRNITQAVKVPLYLNEDQHLSYYGLPFDPVGWLAGDSAILIYDQYDIWQVDPMGKKVPINITEGYGRKHRTTFRIISDQSGLITTDTLLLTALDQDNKYNGFWKKKLGTTSAPVPLSDMLPYLYYFPGIGGTDVGERPPLKAKNARVYMIRRMSASESPNLFATKDFQSFTPLSDIYPEKEYNWISSELIGYQMPDGKMGEGILYKPKNFDPKKKYPIIFYYYDKLSQRLFVCPKPGLSTGILNIPTYVSNGYLVCVPNIYYTSGRTGQSAVNSVVSAAKYLSKFPWVDVTKMGLQGHSFGGYETNYIITHSTLFAAAQTSAGASNFANTFGGLSHGEKSSAFQTEIGQYSLGTTPWLRPDIYVENSPVFSLDKVKTPLLIQHNKQDGVVPFAEGLAIFTGLRRLQKPVWLLQYTGEEHVIIADPANQLDFTIRQQQFFDHYLKGKPAPEWMIKGIPAKYKGIKSGLGFSER